MLERLKGYVQNPVFLFILWMGRISLQFIIDDEGDI